jgi:hypothetical protein
MGFTRLGSHNAAWTEPRVSTGDGGMARTIVLRTNEDARCWLVNLETKTVSEFANDDGPEQDPDLEPSVVVAADVRSNAAAHAWFGN